MSTEKKLTPLQELLDFVIEQRLDLKDYDTVLPERISERFWVNDIKTGLFASRNLVDLIISWENGNHSASLEQTINESFKIQARHLKPQLQ